MEKGGEGGDPRLAVVSVSCSSSSGSKSVVRAQHQYDMKNISDMRSTKDREVGPGGRKCSGNNSLHTTHINPPCSISESGKYSPVVLSSCSPTQQHTSIPIYHNISHHAGESCGTLACSTHQPHNKAVYGLPQCRSASVIDNESV